MTNFSDIAFATSMSAELEAVSDVAVIGRQAIMNADRKVFGYELFDRSTARSAHTAVSDAALLFNALCYGGSEALVGKHAVFINCTHESLVGGHLELIHPDRVVLEVPKLPEGACTEAISACLEVFESLRFRGFRLAFDQTVLRRSYASWLPLASFIKLDMLAFEPELAQPLVQFARANSEADIIAEKVETAEQFQRMADLGVKLFQGFWFAKPSLVQAKTIRPSQESIIQLITLVRKQASAVDIEEMLKRDPALSFNLLRYIDSSGFGLNVEITSFRHAVMILGLKKLFSWAALMLTTSQAGASPPAVGTLAVVRGRLMELLARELLTQEECDNAFAAGVFSLLDTMLGVPLDQALDSVALPESVVDALLHNRGVFAPFLALARACESGDDAAFAVHTEALHLSSRQVNLAHLEALDWAEALSR